MAQSESYSSLILRFKLIFQELPSVIGGRVFTSQLGSGYRRGSLVLSTCLLTTLQLPMVMLIIRQKLKVRIFLLENRNQNINMFIIMLVFGSYLQIAIIKTIHQGDQLILVVIERFQILFNQCIFCNFISKIAGRKVMKKMQNYLMKPEELKKKLQNPKFRSTFLEWSKSNISLTKDQNPKPTRTKSPLQHYHKSLNLHRKSTSTQDKQNLKPNSSLTKNSLAKVKLKVTSRQKNSSVKQQKQSPTSGPLSKKRQMSQSSASHIHNIKNYQSNRSLNKNYISSLSSKHRYNSCSSIINENGNNKNKANSSLGRNDSLNEIKKKSGKQEVPKFGLRYAYRTKQGVQVTNPNKTNQDSLLIKTNLSTYDGSSIFAVADGHGMYGHLVSQYLVKNLSKHLQQEAKKGKAALIQCIPTVYNKLQQGLFNNPQINASCSGSTLVNVVVQKEQIICANVGDSRAILARQIDKKNWEMIYLSQDHKPTVQAEKKRVLKNGGRIHAFRDESGCPVGPQRVWLPKQNMQGLAMSRSFGDNVSKPIGVTHIPEIINLKIDKKDRFILIASDGVWEFITNQEVLQLLVPFYRDNKLQEACDALMKLAYQRWTVEDKSIVDDITMILIFFQHQKDPTIM